MNITLLKNLLTPIVIINPYEEIIEANDSFYDIFGDIKSIKKLTDKDEILSNLIKKMFIDTEIKVLEGEMFEWNNNSKKQYYFDIELIRIDKVFTKQKNCILIFFKDITQQYKMAQKTIRRSEELSILLEISLSEPEIKDHLAILSSVSEKITQLTKFNYAVFVYYKSNKSIQDCLNYNLPNDIFNSFQNKIYSKDIPSSFKESQKPVILKFNDIYKFDIFKQFKSLKIEEVIVFPVGIYGLFFFFSNNPNILRITEEENFFALLGQEIGRSLYRANLYHRLEHSINELERNNYTLNKQLRIAQSIQSSIMFNQNNNNVGIEYSVKYIPSDFLSGDLYDVWKISDNKVSVLIADVCGHGVSSALIATFMKATLKEIVNDKSTTGEILSKLNNRLVDILPLDMYVSAFLVIIDTEEKIIEYSSAGHPAQIYYDFKSQTMDETKGLGDTLLSIIPNVYYKTYQKNFNKGDRLLLFTDGIYELRKENGEIYGRKKFYKLVEKYISLNKDEILNKIIKNAYDVTERNFLEDDVNIILIDL